MVRSVERHLDGSEIVTEYEEALPYNDPYVRSRQRTVGDRPPREIVTEFLPSPVRPPTYPAGFPFLPGRACHTTESPAHQMSPGVRWRCDDPDTVLTALIDMSLAEGWTAMAASDVEPIMRENLKAAFRRGNDIRQFSRIELDQGSIVSMLDLPGDW